MTKEIKKILTRHKLKCAFVFQHLCTIFTALIIVEYIVYITYFKLIEIISRLSILAT